MSSRIGRRARGGYRHRGKPTASVPSTCYCLAAALSVALFGAQLGLVTGNHVHFSGMLLNVSPCDQPNERKMAHCLRHETKRRTASKVLGNGQRLQRSLAPSATELYGLSTRVLERVAAAEKIAE